MKSHIIPLVLLVGIICAALIAAHSHDFIGLEESSGSGNNSAEEFMNEMEARFGNWSEEDNGTDYSSGDYNDEAFVGPRIIVL